MAKQTEPNPHDVLRAINLLSDTPEVQAYSALLTSVTPIGEMFARPLAVDDARIWNLAIDAVKEQIASKALHEQRLISPGVHRDLIKLIDMVRK